MSKNIILANWKSNPATLKEAEDLFHFSCDACGDISTEKVETIICPPFVYLEKLSAVSSNVALGAQNMFWEKIAGPYTGEITPDILKNLSVQYVLIGHSERRYNLGETDTMVNKKIKAALDIGITPVVLIGEKEKKDDGSQIIENQLTMVLDGLSADQVSKTILVYEPIWAVSTGNNSEADTPEHTLDTLGTIKNVIFSAYRLRPDSYKILYGGSINEKNVADFLSHDEINGAVIGGASLRKNEFANIIKIVSEL